MRWALLLGLPLLGWLGCSQAVEARGEGGGNRLFRSLRRLGAQDGTSDSVAEAQQGVSGDPIADAEEEGAGVNVTTWSLGAQAATNSTWTTGSVTISTPTNGGAGGGAGSGATPQSFKPMPENVNGEKIQIKSIAIVAGVAIGVVLFLAVAAVRLRYYVLRERQQADLRMRRRPGSVDTEGGAARKPVEEPKSGRLQEERSKGKIFVREESKLDSARQPAANKPEFFHLTDIDLASPSKGRFVTPRSPSV
jgi:hypothetical protein